MVIVYFEESANSDRKKIGKYKTLGEASTAAANYAIENRLPVEQMKHKKDDRYDYYDMGVYGRFVLYKE